MIVAFWFCVQLVQYIEGMKDSEWIGCDLDIRHKIWGKRSISAAPRIAGTCWSWSLRVIDFISEKDEAHEAEAQAKSPETTQEVDVEQKEEEDEERGGANPKVEESH